MLLAIAGVVFASFLVWRFAPRKACSCCSLPPEEDYPPGFHARGGHKLHYTVDQPADGVPAKGTVLLLHGMLTSGRYWRLVSSALVAQGYRCIAPDMLGFGRSPWPRGGCTVEAHVEHLKAVLAEVLLDDDEHQTREDGIVIVGHSFGSLVAFELARVLNAQGPANQENEEAPADKTSSAEFPLLSEVPAARHCGVKVKGAALLAMPFYEEPGDASRGLKRTPKGCFVAGLINCPGAAFILCTLICQQRWLWLPLYRALRATLVAVGAVAVVVPEQRQGGGPAAGSSSSTSDAATDAVEDFMLHSFYSCMETFNAINQHRVLTETKATGAFADRIAVDIIRDENRTQMLSLSTTTLAPELGLLTPAAPPTTPTANAAMSLLLVHGALDDIVPVERSKSFVEALQSRGLLVPPASSFAGGGDGNPTKLRGSSPSSSVHFANKFDMHLEVLPDADHALASHPEHASSTIVAIERWICLLKS